jgi:hypothetical protein
MGRGARGVKPPKVTFVVPIRPDPEVGVHYVAFFRKEFRDFDPRLKEMMVFARRIGTRLDFCPSGHPFRDMVCHLDLGILSEAEAAEFGRLFSPDCESPIPLL